MFFEDSIAINQKSPTFVYSNEDVTRIINEDNPVKKYKLTEKELGTMNLKDEINDLIQEIEKKRENGMIFGESSHWNSYIKINEKQPHQFTGVNLARLKEILAMMKKGKQRHTPHEYGMPELETQKTSPSEPEILLPEKPGCDLLMGKGKINTNTPSKEEKHKNGALNNKLEIYPGHTIEILIMENGFVVNCQNKGYVAEELDGLINILLGFNYH